MLPVVMLVNVNDFYSYSSGDNVAPGMPKFSTFQPITNLKYFPTSIFNGVEVKLSLSQLYIFNVTSLFCIINFLHTD